MTIAKNKKISKELGRNLKKIRTRKNMSQGDIARALEVHRSYISGIERGVRNPTLINIERIAKVLDVAISKLLK